MRRESEGEGVKEQTLLYEPGRRTVPTCYAPPCYHGQGRGVRTQLDSGGKGLVEVTRQELKICFCSQVPLYLLFLRGDGDAHGAFGGWWTSYGSRVHADDSGPDLAQGVKMPLLVF